MEIFRILAPKAIVQILKPIQYTMKKITILLVEDHHLIRRALAYFLNEDSRFEVIAEASGGEEAFEKVTLYQPDVILMDISLIGMNGIEATAKINKAFPEIKIIAMTMHKEAHCVDHMMRAGAVGYLNKNISLEELLESIIVINNGGKFLSAEVRDTLLDRILDIKSPETGSKRLSKREAEIARHIKEGKRTKQIASDLGISVRTVEVHRYNIIRKLKAENSISLVSYLHQNPYVLERVSIV